MTQKKKKMNKPDADRLIRKTNKDPHGARFYHPVIHRAAIAGAVAGGIIVGVVFWLIAKGVIPVEGLGQLAAGSLGAAAFFGFAGGSAAGGFIGGIYGIFVMQKK